MEQGTKNLVCGEPFRKASENLGVRLSSEALEQFETYVEGIKAWSARGSLVSRNDLGVLAERHFLECLALVPFLPEGPFDLLDLGSGAGLPGIPVKIVRPEVHVSLLESKRTRTLFLAHIREVLGLSGLEVIRARAEQACLERDYRTQFRVVTARAVTAFPLLWQLAVPFLEPGGELIAFKGPGEFAEVGESLPEEVIGREEVLEIPGAEAGRALVFLKIDGDRMRE